MQVRKLPGERLILLYRKNERLSLPLVDGLDLRQFDFELLIPGHQAVAVTLCFLNLKHRLLTLIHPQMDQCRKGKKDRKEKSTVCRSDPRGGERNTMETPDFRGNA